MKKSLSFVIVAFVLMMVTSCTHNNTTTITPTTNTFTYKTTTYNATTVVQSSSSLQASDGTTGSAIFIFTSYPTTSGIYQVATGSSPSSSNQVAINYANLNTGITYTGAPSATVNATVTVSSTGKVTIVVPTVTVVSRFNSADTGPFTANLTQQ